MNISQPGSIHILVVDDEETVREIMQRAIKNAGYHCITARNVEEALQVLEETSIDVVITDIAMPGASGITLLEKVKEKHSADVMVMTGFTEGLKYEEIIEKGACDFIQKPVSTKELLVRLKRVLRERSVLTERNQAEKELKEISDEGGARFATLIELAASQFAGKQPLEAQKNLFLAYKARSDYLPLINKFFKSENP